MSQVDNRNSSAAKRARTDGSRREDDWTCPSCGNVNFSFRTTCNMRNCTQPRPADHNSKSAAKPLQAPQGYSSAAPYLGSNAPASIYLGVPPYGSSLFNGSSIPPYEVPFSGGSAYHYNYGSRLSAGSPYRPLHLPAPTPYASGSMIGNGGIYGMPPLLDRYGLAMPIGPGTMGPRPGFFPDDKSQKKGADATRDNDWTCPKCGNVNFSFRPVCNMRKCNTPKPGSQASKSDKSSKQKMPEGSWKCEKCNNINYPFRTKCNRQNCGADKPAESEKSPSPAPDQNDQVVTVEIASQCRETSAEANEVIDPFLQEVLQAVQSQAKASLRLAHAMEARHPPAPPVNKEVQRFKDFKNGDPPIFHGELDPDLADNWIQGVEQVFEDVPCTDAQKIKFATRQLRDQATSWWKAVKPILQPTEERLTWEGFKAAFYEKYFPQSVRDAKDCEFLDLVQGDMSVLEYTTKFDQLCRHSTTYRLNPNEAWKCMRYEWGLRPELNEWVTVHYIREYATLVNRCMAQEESTMRRVATDREAAKRKRQEGETLNQPLRIQY